MIFRAVQAILLVIFSHTGLGISSLALQHLRAIYSSGESTFQHFHLWISCKFAQSCFPIADFFIMALFSLLDSFGGRPRDFLAPQSSCNRRKFNITPEDLFNFIAITVGESP